MQPAEFQKTFETVRNGTVTAHKLDGVPGKLSGCVYRSDFSKVQLSERFGGFMGDFIVSDNPDRLAEHSTGRRLGGRGIYLGHFMGGHYGHFITETLSTFWIFEQEQPANFDYFLFHPFVFGDAVPPFAKSSLARFEITPEKMVLVGEDDLAFDELVVPERLFRLNHSADPAARWVYQHIAAGSSGPAEPSPKLYLSRRRFSRTHFERVIANEVDIEAAFERRGFKVIYPETMSFDDQVGYYSRADYIAGQSGSALHNSLFLRPGAKVVELGDPRYGGEPAPTQALCDRISGATNIFIPFTGWKIGSRGTMLFDMTFLKGRLSSDVGDEFSDSRTRRRGLGQRARELAEVGYLTFRPWAGAVLRQWLKRKKTKP